jgi:SOS-response transcriptional repressor LexA
MTSRDFPGADWDEDALLIFLGRQLVERTPRLVEDDERFMNWLAKDLRRRPGSLDDWSSQRVRRVRQRVLERALAERFAVKRGDRLVRRQVEGRALREAVEHAAQARCAPWTPLAAAAGIGRDLWDEECDQWVELPPSTKGGRFVALQVAGDSMTPLLHPGDTILVRLGSAVKRDTIALVRSGDDGYVVKRVGRVGRREIELLSINKSYPPLVLPRDQGDVLGTIIMRWCVHNETAIAGR